MNILNATPYDLGLPRLRYVSSHWWRESVPEKDRVIESLHPVHNLMMEYTYPYGNDDILGRIKWSLERRPHWSGPTTAVLIDREGTDAETLVKVLEAFAELLPTCFRIVYDPELRVVYPDQAPKTDAVIGNRSVDQYEQLVGRLAHAFAADCYLMGIPMAFLDPEQEPLRFTIRTGKTLAELPTQLDLTRAAATTYEGTTGRPVWPCVHERYHHGKGCGHNIFQTVEVWKRYNAIVGERWPGPRVWWSGSMRRNPGNEADGWTLPSEHDMRQFADVVR